MPNGKLVVEVVDTGREKDLAVVHEEMGNAIELSVPLEVSIGCGRSWDTVAQ